VKGFWSLTMYNPQHYFYPNPLKRYALGTKNKSLNYNPDGSLTTYFGQNRPAQRRNPTGCPRRPGIFRFGSAPIGLIRLFSTALGSRPL